MSHRKSISFLAALAFALSLFADNVQADNSPGQKPAIQPRPFEAVVRNGEIIGWEQVRRVFVNCGTNQFVFVAPHGLRVEASPAMVAVASPDSTYYLAFRVLSAAEVDPNSDNVDFYRELACGRFPRVKVVEETAKAAAGRSGFAFDMRVKIVGEVERTVYVALIPSAAGVLEFTLNADPAKLTDARNAFNIMLRTFRSNESGKIDITPTVSGQS